MAMTDDPKNGYMTLLNKRINEKTDEKDDAEADAPAECDRENCTEASAPLSTRTGL
jgi:hypothetical protein